MVRRKTSDISTCLLYLKNYRKYPSNTSQIKPPLHPSSLGIAVVLSSGIKSQLNYNKVWTEVVLFTNHYQAWQDFKISPWLRSPYICFYVSPSGSYRSQFLNYRIEIWHVRSVSDWEKPISNFFEFCFFRRKWRKNHGFSAAAHDHIF